MKLVTRWNEARKFTFKSQFDWDSLQKYEWIYKSESRNLQDYWRWGPGSGRKYDKQKPLTDIDIEMKASGELVEAPDGVFWHIAHVPLFWSNGEPTFKTLMKSKEEALLTKLLTNKYQAMAKSILDYQKLGDVSDDIRLEHANRLYFLMLDGVYLNTPLTPTKDLEYVAISAQWSFFRNGFQFKNARFVPGCNFKGCYFGTTSTLENSELGKPLGININNETEELTFDYAAFEEYTTLKNVKFGSSVSFQFILTGEGVDFSHTKYEDDCSFYHAVLGPRNKFDECVFAKNTNFQYACFGEGTRFSEAKFGLKSNFRDTVFDGSSTFSGTEFRAKTNFNNAIFNGPVDFSSIDHNKDGMSAGGTEFPKINFCNCVFGSSGDFSNRNFKRKSGFNNSVWRGTPIFHGAILNQATSFNGASFPCVDKSLWDIEIDENDQEALLDKLSKLGFKESKTFMEEKNELKEMMNPPLDQKLFRTKKDFLALLDISAKKIDDLEIYYSNMEDAFRTLKLAMENCRSKIEEFRFYRLELISRRSRTDTTQVPKSETFFSYLYSWSSNYGFNFVKPLVILSFVTAIWTSFYWALGLLALDTKSPDRDYAILSSVGYAAQHSIQNVIRPFSSITTEFSVNSLPVVSSPSPNSLFLDHVYGEFPLIAVTLSFLESLFGISLIFLFLLSLRRRFQIS